MKILLKYFILLYLINTLFFANQSLSQLINKWEIVDSTNSEYWTYFSGKGNISGYSEDNIVVIGGYFHSMDYYKNLYTIKLYENKATTSKVIYQDSIETSHRLLSIAHPSDSLIVVVGDSSYYQGTYPENPPSRPWYKFWGLLMISIDKGKSWQRKILDSNKSLISISMYDDMNGIIYQKKRNNYLNQDFLSTDSLLITEIGWKDYWSIPISNEAGIISQCYCLAKDKYFLKSSNFIYFSLDGGQNWKKTSDFEGYAIDMEIIDDNVFYVTANIKPFSDNNLNEPILYKTSNAGETWVECKEFYKGAEKYSDVNSIDFYDELNGIATFQSEILLKTTDGGNTWNKEYLPYIFEAGTFNWANSPYYPNKDFCFTTGFKDYTFVFKGKKILSKPQFYEMTNYRYLPVNELKIEWEPVYEATYYRMKIDTIWLYGNTSLEGFNQPWKDTMITSTSIKLSSLINSTWYSFWLKAISESIESDWSIYGVRTIDSVGYYTPEIIEPGYGERISNSKVTINWNKVTPVERYKLEIENSINDDYVNTIVTDTFYVLENLIPSAYYLITLSSLYWNSEESYFKTESVLGIEDKEKKNQETELYIFPNPVYKSCKIILFSDVSTPALLNIYNILGTRVSSQEIQLREGENIIQHNIETLTSGIYFFEIISSDGIKRGMFIKQ